MFRLEQMPPGESASLLVRIDSPASLAASIDTKHLPHLATQINICLEILRNPRQERCIKYSMASTGAFFLLLALLCFAHAVWDTFECPAINDECGKFRIPELIGIVFFSLLGGIATITYLHRAPNRSPLALLNIDELQFIDKVGKPIGFNIAEYSTLSTALAGFHDKVKLASPHHSVGQDSRLFATHSAVPLPNVVEVIHPSL